MLLTEADPIHPTCLNEIIQPFGNAGPGFPYINLTILNLTLILTQCFIGFLNLGILHPLHLRMAEVTGMYHGERDEYQFPLS